MTKIADTIKNIDMIIKHLDQLKKDILKNKINDLTISISSYNATSEAKMTLQISPRQENLQ